MHQKIAGFECCRSRTRRRVQANIDRHVIQRIARPACPGREFPWHANIDSTMESCEDAVTVIRLVMVDTRS